MAFISAVYEEGNLYDLSRDFFFYGGEGTSRSMFELEAALCILFGACPEEGGPTGGGNLPPCKGLFGKAHVTSEFGNEKPPYSPEEPHPGVDFANNLQSFHVSAVRGGDEARVVFRGIMPGYGRTVIVQLGPNSYDLYGGLDSISVSNGQGIDPNTRIGTAGTSVGPMQKATGPHLHYQRIEGPLTTKLASGKVVINRDASVRPCR
jgi:murein DD-endopeptidase MepM/ murein hydrolase activator NlpD